MTSSTSTQYGTPPSYYSTSSQSLELTTISEGDKSAEKELDVVDGPEEATTQHTPAEPAPRKMGKIITFLKSLKGFAKSTASLEKSDSPAEDHHDSVARRQRRSLTHPEACTSTSQQGKKAATIAKMSISQKVLPCPSNGDSSSSSSSSGLRSSLNTQQYLLRDALSKCLQPILSQFPTVAFHSIQLENVIAPNSVNLNQIVLNLHEGNHNVIEGIAFQDPNDSFNEKPLEHGVVESSFADLQRNLLSRLPDSNIGAAFINTYPRNVKPSQINCDAFSVFTKENFTLSVVADGCGWGVNPRKAAQRAISGVINYLDEVLKDEKNPINTAQDLAQHLICSLANAHAAIFAPEFSIDQCGTTTINICMKFKDVEGVSYLMNVGVGDCKALIVTENEDGSFETKEVLPHRRFNLKATDPGGRIGPYCGTTGFDPDLRNLSLVCLPLPTNNRCWIFNMTDGLHDNFNPIELGKYPSELNADLGLSLSWNDVSPEMRISMMNHYQNTLFGDKVKEALIRDQSLDSICSYLIEYARQVTEPIRNLMENTNSFEPDDKREYPGKVDHCSVVVFRG